MRVLISSSQAGSLPSGTLSLVARHCTLVVWGDFAGARVPFEKFRENTLKLQTINMIKDPQSALYRKQKRLGPPLKIINYLGELPGQSWRLTTRVIYRLITGNFQPRAREPRNHWQGSCCPSTGSLLNSGSGLAPAASSLYLPRTGSNWAA